jgi:sensor histidine kinase YesM
MTGFETVVIVALLGIWSCVGVIYTNSRKASKQFDEIVSLLGQIASQR